MTHLKIHTITKHLKKAITITDTTKITILLATKKMVQNQSAQIPPHLINTKYGNGSNDCLGTADCFTGCYKGSGRGYCRCK